MTSLLKSFVATALVATLASSMPKPARADVQYDNVESSKVYTFNTNWFDMGADFGEGTQCRTWSGLIAKLSDSDLSAGVTCKATNPVIDIEGSVDLRGRGVVHYWHGFASFKLRVVPSQVRGNKIKWTRSIAGNSDLSACQGEAKNFELSARQAGIEAYTSCAAGPNGNVISVEYIFSI